MRFSHIELNADEILSTRHCIFNVGLSRDVGLFGVRIEPFSGQLTVLGPAVTPQRIFIKKKAKKKYRAALKYA